MAYLTLAGSEERQNSSFVFIGSDNKTQSTGLISNSTSLISSNISLLSNSDDCGLDTCSFYSGPTDSAIMAFGETCGSIAYSDAGETCGSIAYSGGTETCGSIASSSSSSSSSSFSGGCSYSC